MFGVNSPKRPPALKKAGTVGALTLTRRASQHLNLKTRVSDALAKDVDQSPKKPGDVTLPSARPHRDGHSSRPSSKPGSRRASVAEGQEHAQGEKGQGEKGHGEKGHGRRKRSITPKAKKGFDPSLVLPAVKPAGPAPLDTATRTERFNTKHVPRSISDIQPTWSRLAAYTQLSSQHDFPHCPRTVSELRTLVSRGSQAAQEHHDKLRTTFIMRQAHVANRPMTSPAVVPPLDVTSPEITRQQPRMLGPSTSAFKRFMKLRHEQEIGKAGPIRLNQPSPLEVMLLEAEKLRARERGEVHVLPVLGSPTAQGGTPLGGQVTEQGGGGVNGTGQSVGGTPTGGGSGMGESGGVVDKTGEQQPTGDSEPMDRPDTAMW